MGFQNPSNQRKPKQLSKSDGFADFDGIWPKILQYGARTATDSLADGLLLSSFTVRRGNEVFSSLAAAMDRNPLLQVRLAVNVGRDGDYSASEHQILTQFAELAEAGSLLKANVVGRDRGSG